MQCFADNFKADVSFLVTLLSVTVLKFEYIRLQAIRSNIMLLKCDYLICRFQNPGFGLSPLHLRQNLTVHHWPILHSVLEHFSNYFLFSYRPTFRVMLYLKFHPKEGSEFQKIDSKLQIL